MKVQHEPSPLPDDTAACVGAFDGMHRGHAALLARGRELCRNVAIVSFEPHPARVLAPERAPRLLHTPIQRERTCRALGVDVLVLLPFDRTMAALSAEQFVSRFVVRGLRPRAVVVGEDFRFGAGRGGGTNELRELLARDGLELHVVADVPDPHAGERRLSSTSIRGMLEDGEVGRAGTLLARWYRVVGTVKTGDRRGRRLGYPTANVHCPDAFLPRSGTYAAALAIWSESSMHHGRVWPAVANLGKRPTFVGQTDPPTVLEVHALDVTLGDELYDTEVEVSFIHRLRDELAFSGADALVEQIRADIEAARPHLTQPNLDLVLRPPEP